MTPLNKALLGGGILAVSVLVWSQLNSPVAADQVSSPKPQQVEIPDIQHRERTSFAGQTTTTAVSQPPEAKAPGKAKPPTKAEIFQVEVLDTKALTAEFRDWDDDAIDKEVAFYNSRIDSARYLERLNNNELSNEELQDFSDLMITLDTLMQVKSERELAKLEEMLANGPQSATDQD